MKIEFGEPRHGWISVCIECGGRAIEFDASYIYPSFWELISALHVLATTSCERTANWALEPAEFEMRFERNQTGDLTFWLTEFADDRRLSTSAYSRLKYSGSYVDVCVPFWRALRGIQGRYSPEEWAGRWMGAFPYAELDGLTTMLRERGIIA